MKKWITSGGYTIDRVITGRSNVFLITYGNIKILVDTSTRGNYKKLIKVLEQLNCKNILYLVLTHTHFDHAANAKSIKNHLNTKIIVHSKEAHNLEAGYSKLPQGTNIFTEFLMGRIGNNQYLFAKYDTVSSDLLIDEEYNFNAHGINLSIIHTPGHTLGSISIIVDGEIAIVGDALFGMFKNSVFPPFADNPKLMVESWSKLINTGCKVFLPSHGNERNEIILSKEYLKYKDRFTD